MPERSGRREAERGHDLDRDERRGIDRIFRLLRILERGVVHGIGAPAAIKTDKGEGEEKKAKASMCSRRSHCCSDRAQRILEHIRDAYTWRRARSNRINVPFRSLFRLGERGAPTPPLILACGWLRCASSESDSLFAHVLSDNVFRIFARLRSAR